MNPRGNKRCLAPLCLVFLAGCSDLGVPLKLLPHIELSTTSVDFGTVLVGGSATRNVVVGNSGNGSLAGFAAVSCPGFSLDSGGGAFTVPPGGQHTIVVRYQPSTPGSSPCELSLGAGLPPVTLSGAAALQLPGAQCTVSVPSLGFGLLAVGGSQLAQFTARSVGTANVFLNVAASCGDFTVVSGGGPHTLLPGDSLAVTVGFTPSVGGHIACTIATGPGCPDVAVSGDATSVSFAAQIQPILDNQSKQCVFCHVPWRPNNLVNVPSPGYSAVRVKPFDPAHSVLYGKVTGTAYGARMPLSGQALSGPEQTLIRTWILEGAHNN